MRGKKLAALAVAVFVAAAAALLAAGDASAAGLISSNHDMISRYSYTSAAAKKGACSFCHIPHGAGAKLYGGAIDPATVPGDWAGDAMAAICYECHGGGTTHLLAKQVTVFDSGLAHSNIIGSSKLGGETINQTGIHGIYDNGSGTMKISCTSCHDVHNNAVRPFLRDYAATVVEGNLQSLCVKCHNTRAQNANSGTRTNHPTGIDQNVDWTAKANIIAKASMSALAQQRLASNWADLSLEISTAAGTDHYNLGGKYQTTANSNAKLTGGTVFDCGTCHAVHNNELAYGSDAANDGLAGQDVGTAIGSAGNALQPLSDGASTFGSIEPLCAGCHANVANTSGPGAASTFSHPTWSQTTGGVWPSGITVVGPVGSKWGVNGSERSIACQSCHDVHFAKYPGVGGASPPAGDNALLGFSCNECHGQSTTTGHHPSGVAIDDSLDVDRTKAATTMDTYAWSGIAALAEATRTKVTDEDVSGFRTTGSVAYTFPGGNMGCGTCHTAASIHNSATAWVPTLVRTNDQSQMCVDCHGTNPSNNTTVFGQGTSSNVRLGTHFVGTITNVNYKWAQGNGTAATPQSGQTVKYGTSGSNGAIICESCHTLKFKALTAAQLDNTHSINDSATETSTRNIRLLLTPSGNSHETTDGSKNLCTACHGSAIAISGKSGSHPVMMMAGKDNVATGYITTIEGNNDNVSLTTNSKVNCESCHRPHDATTGATTRILEISEGSTATFLNEQGLCIACHGTTIPVN